MIVSTNVSIYRAFYNLWRPLTTLTTWAGLLTLGHHLIPESPLWVSPIFFTVLGGILGVYLAFRNNAAYDRYWEGRGLWGRLINVSRTTVRQAATYIRSYDGTETAEREAFIRAVTYRIISFAHTLRHHLRNEDPYLEMVGLLSIEEITRIRSARNVPAAILMLLGEQLALAKQWGWMDSITVTAMDGSLTEFATVQGSCERIRNTPLPPVYSHIGHRLVLLYCTLLPFGLVKDLGIVTPVAVAAVALAFLVLSRISLLLENPFGLFANDLPLTTMCRTIEIDLRQSLGETNVPQPIQPENGILL